MTKPFLRSVLAGIAAAGFASAQTPPTSTPPVIQQVAFKVSPAPAKPAEKVVVKVLDVADLVCPPADSPLAKPGSDAAMKAAAKAYTEARAEQLMKTIRSTVERDSWEAGGTGTLDYYETGTSLVVRNCPATVARVAECVEAMRKLRDTQVMVEMRLLTVPSGSEAVKKLLDGKQHAPLPTAELKAMLDGLMKDGQVQMLSQPRVMLLNKQTGFVQVGQQCPQVTAVAANPNGQPVAKVEYAQVGLMSRMTPEVAADFKSVRLKLDVELSEANRTPVDLGNGQKACAIDRQAMETTLAVPDGGSMAVMVGTKKAERRVEHKVPMLGDLPYLSRLFRNVGVSMESTDTVAVVTVRLVAVKDTPVAPPVAMPMPVPPRLAPLPPVAPVTMPRPVAIPVPPVGQLVPPMMPVAPLPMTPTATPRPVPPMPVAVVPPMMPVPAPVAYPADDYASRWIVYPTPMARTPVPVAPPLTSTVGPDGLVRIGVDFNEKPTATAVLAPVADPLMTAYKAACAAGRKDEAARLALQLLAKDPTCFGRDK